MLRQELQTMTNTTPKFFIVVPSLVIVYLILAGMLVQALYSLVDVPVLMSIFMVAGILGFLVMIFYLTTLEKESFVFGMRDLFDFRSGLHK